MVGLLEDLGRVVFWVWNCCCNGRFWVEIGVWVFGIEGWWYGVVCEWRGVGMERSVGCVWG